MNANKTMIVLSTTMAAVTALAVAFPAAAEDHRGSRRGERPAAVARHAPPSAAAVRHADFPRAQQRRVEVERRVVQHHRPVVVQRPVYVQRTVVVQRPAPVYYPAARPVYARAPARVYYDQPVVYADNDHNPAGAIAGAVIGGVIGSQVGDYETRGITTVIGAIFGGIIGGGF